MDLKQLEYIVAIEEEQSISKAAAKLYITQSALNQQLLKLEKELGVRLFTRRNHLMEPTFAGKVYLSTARRMLDMKNEAYKIIRDIADEQTGEIPLTFTPEKGSLMFSGIYPAFHKMYPNIQFRIFEARVKPMGVLLSQHKVDLAFIVHLPGITNPDFEYDDYYTENMVLGVPITHPLAKLAGENSAVRLPCIDLKLLRNESFVMMTHETLMRDMIDMAVQEAGFQPKILFESSSTRTIFNMVSQQICPAFFPQSYVDPDAPVVYFSVGRDKLYSSWIQSAVHPHGIYLSTAEKYLVHLARNYTQRNAPPDIPQNHEEI
jgi:DNA-binding transcriptional LysR family regulator